MDQVKIFNNELSSLYESKPPISKAKMTQLTRSAIKGIKFYKHVVQSVEKFIQKCRPEYKVPGLYVIDSIVRQSRHQFGYDRDVFVPRFSKNIVATFQCLYKCPSEEKPKIVKVLNLWQKNNVFPTEIIQPLLDMANMESTDIKTSGDEAQFKPWTGTNQTSDGPSNNVQGSHNKEKDEEGPVLNSAIISQLQELTSQLLNNPKMSDSQLKQENAVKFNKKLLDFDYGDEEEEAEPEEEEKEENGHSAPTEPTAIALSMAQNLLSNPELLKQLQQMQQTIQQTEALKNELTITERKQEELQQPQSSQQQVNLQGHHQLQTQQQQQELHLQQQIHQQPPPIHQQQLHQQQMYQDQVQQSHQSLEVNFNHPKSTHQNFQDVTFPGAQNIHPDISLPIKQPQINLMGIGNQSHAYSPLFPPQSQNFSPGATMMSSHDQNFSMNQAIRSSNRMGINSTVMDMEHSISSLPENPSQLMHDQDERQMWGIHQKELEERDRGKKDRSRSRSRSPRNRSKSSRKHKRSRSRSPKRRRSSSRSPSRHRRDKRSDSRDYERERDSERERERFVSDRDKERDREKDNFREKDNYRERKKKGLPVLKKNNVAVCSTTLWLGHVPKMVPENEIKEIFEEFGAVTSVDVWIHPLKGRLQPNDKGCAYICMEKRQDASKSLSRLKNLKLQGNSIKMAWAPGKGVKGKEYKSYWDVEQGVTYIPYDKLPDKSNFLDLGEGGMIDEESVPDHLKDVLVNKEERAKAASSEIALPKEGESADKAQAASTKDSKNQPQLNQLALKPPMSVPSLATQQEQASLMAGPPLHMPMMTTMPPPQFGLGIPGMVGPQVQPMLIPQIPLPMGVPPPNQIMMMNHGALMNPPPSMAVMQSAMASLQTPHLLTSVSGLTLPPNNVSNDKTNDSDQMDENSDATPTEEDRLRSSRVENESGADVDSVKTNTSLPSNFPSNPPTSIPFSSAYAPNVSGSLVVTSSPSMAGGHPLNLPILTSHSQPWPPNPNGPPGMFRMPGGLGMPPQFNHMPPPPNNPPLMNPNMPPPPFGHGANHNLIRPPPNNMGGFGSAPSPNLPSPDNRNKNNKNDEFDPNISANCVPLGRSRINFGSQSPQRQSPGGPGPGPGPGSGMRLLGPPPDNRGLPPRMGGPNPMRLPPPPQDMGFRPQRPLIGGPPNFGGQGPPPPRGIRFPFGRGQDGPMGQRQPPPFMMRGPAGPGMGHRMEFRGPPPADFRDERFGPEWRGRPPFGPPPMDRDFFKGNDMRMERNMDFPPDDWNRGLGDDARGRRQDGRRGFGPPDERGWIPPDGRMDNEEFGGPRDPFEHRGFEDRRRMMERGDRGRFNFGPGPREWDRDFDREMNRRDNDSESIRDGDRHRGRDRGDRGDRRDRRESRWNRSRSRSREPLGDLAKNGEIRPEDDKEVLIICEGPSTKKPVEIIDVDPIPEGPKTNETKLDSGGECQDNSNKLPATSEKVPSENNTPVNDEISPPKDDLPVVEC